MNYYYLNICGFNKKLPIVKIGPQYSIASFSLLGDVDLVEVIAFELVERIKYLDFEMLVGLEIQVLPLLYQMSHLLGQKNYVILRTKVLAYMEKAIKNQEKKPLVLNGQDALLIKNKKVVLVNDVVSTGRTVVEMQNLVKQVGAKTVAVVSVLKQGELKLNLNLPFFYLKTLPLFKK